MAFSQDLADRLRTLVKSEQFITEQKMFGGLCFLYKGKMCCGVVEDKIALRVLEPKCSELLSQPGITPMNFTGKPKKEFVYITDAWNRSDEELQAFLQLGIDHARSIVGEIGLSTSDY